MRTTIFLILLVVISAFAKQPLWPKTLIQSVDGKSFAELCTKSEYCKGASQTSLSDPARFKLSVKNETTLLLSYKNSIVPVSYKAGSTEYKVNHKTLDLKSLTDLNEIQNEVIKRLPNTTQVSLSALWIEPAYADGPYPSYELGMALTKLMVENQEAKICEQAEEIKKKCDPFFNLPLNLDQPQTEDMASALKNKKKLLTSLKTINGQLTHYLLLFPTAMKHKEVLKKCGKLEALNECQKSLEKAKVAFNSYKSNNQIETELELVESALDQMGQAYDMPQVAPVAPASIKPKENLNRR